MVDSAAIVAALALSAGIIFAAGQVSARVSSLEQWRSEMRHELDAIHTQLRHIAGLIKGENT